MDLGRRDFLKICAAGGATVGGAKAVHNVALGYDKNLVSQDLAPVVEDGFGVPFEHTAEAGGVPVEIHAGTVEADGESFRYSNTGSDEARRLDDHLGTDGALEQFAADLSAVEDGDYVFEFHAFEDFFDRLEGAETRGYTVGALRGGYADVPAEKVREFADADPRDSRALLVSLRDVFADETAYDTPRYLAGAVTDNILRRRLRLRPYFEEDVSYEALADGENPRLFCYEYSYRAAEGLHSVPAHEQEPPVLAAMVRDHRHKHVYSGVASVVRDYDREPSLRVPMTFVDYKYTTLRDDFRLTRIGDGINAYNGWHRADSVDWES